MEAMTRYSSITTSQGEHLPLQEMAVAVQLRDAFALVEQTQVWRNEETINIEAVYSFPLPVHATLLGVTVKLNHRTIQAAVAESREAEQAYEQAVIDGDTAMLLEQVEPGMYNLNLGNLLPKDAADIQIRYALPLQWEHRQLRLALPSTVAPRYGSPAAAGLQPLQTPQTNVSVEHGYRLDMTVSGVLAGAGISSPSHPITLKRNGKETHISFANGTAPADRDLVICVTSASAPTATADLAVTNDITLLHAAFPIAPSDQAHALGIKILVDCSGSMSGDSMQLARKAAQHALSQLRRNDRYAVTAFGTHVQQAPGNERRMQTLDEEGIDPKTLRYVRQLDAEMGGTEMIPALRAVFDLEPPGENDQSNDVLLITDGETWQREQIVRLCRNRRHRVFVIGCGACPAESVVREIADATGGGAVFVGPNEDVTAVVDSHLQRMRQPRIKSAAISSTGQLWQVPNDPSRCTFAGDTLHVFTQLEEAVDGPLRLNMEFADGRKEELVVEISLAPEKLADDLIRAGIATRIRETLFNENAPDKAELTQLAVQHQLISPFTHYVMVEKRDAEVGEDPALRQVPNMLAAGWGGAGTIATNDYLEVPLFLRRSSFNDASKCALTEELSHYDLSHSMRTLTDEGRCVQAHPTPGKMIGRLNADFSLLRPKSGVRLSLNEIDDLCNEDVSMLAAEIHDSFEQLASAGWTEEEVLLAFWSTLLEHPVLTALFNRGHRRAILRALRDCPLNSTLNIFMASSLKECTADSWVWTPSFPLPQASQREHQAS